ncbi:phage protein NinX family protein [Salmonella enterica]|uniref:phage protein NinX family protein n=1 Tax=Salmonella enterica TaxID=28901 RepID=UPI002AFF39B7|nr:phage protein NinX family protein [Salmonella enterica]
MNKYRDKSDFEINKAVAEITIYGDWYLSPTDEQPFTFFNYGINSRKTVELPDYCNNPADAMPIIIDNKISLYAPRLNEDWMAEYAGSTEDVNDGFQVDYFDAHNQNPLRAAMEVFLMMKDAENEK